MQAINIKIIFQTIESSYRETFGLLKESIKLGKRLFFSYLLIVTLSSTVFIATSYSKAIGDFMSSSTSTPWGIITSVVVHGGGINHLTFNLLGLLFWFAFLTLTNIDPKNNRIILTTRSYLTLIFSCAFTASFLWLLLRPDGTTSGLSGVVYAAEGVVLALSLVNSLSLQRIKKPIMAQQKRAFLLWLVNVFAVTFILLYLFYSPALFLGEALNVNAFAHGISFLIAFFVTLFYSLIKNKGAMHVLRPKEPKLN